MKEDNNIIKKILHFDNKIIADFYYQKNDKTISSIVKLFSKHYKKLIDFFNIKPPKISIHFIYTRQQMDKHWNKKSPKWLCGMVDHKSIYTIYIFSPLVFEKLTTHKKDEIIPTIIHETAHTFVSQINKKCFAWMNEGVCQFVEENRNKKNMKVKKKDWEWFKDNEVCSNSIITWSEVVEHNGYNIAHAFVKYIIMQYGKDIMIKLLRIKCKGRKKDLEKKISRILGLGQNLDDFLIQFEKRKFST